VGSLRRQAAGKGVRAQDVDDAVNHSHTETVNPRDEVSRDRARYDQKTAGLAGRRVLEVRYWDVHSFADEPGRWDYGDWHSAVMGVELLTDRGPSCVRWTGTFFPYGVEVFHTPMAEHLGVDEPEGPHSEDVSGSDRWHRVLGSPVASVETFWERFTIGPAYRAGVRVSDTHQVDVPVALRIGFAAGPVWMVAGLPRYPGMEEVFVPGDEITVVFSARRMRKIGFPDTGFLSVT
jgi:hypothetical protein